MSETDKITYNKLSIEHLEQIVLKLGFEIRHEPIKLNDNFNNSAGIICTFKGQNIFFLDSNLPDAKKIETLIRELSRFDLDNVFIPPYIRQLIEKKSK